MGRLTLNVLLSFAQFEREVAGERIRDKFAASRRKGMWMGGTIPLGYDVKDRKLVLNDGEAATVRLIFEQYLALGCVSKLRAELDRQGICNKQRRLTSGLAVGGSSFGRGALYHLLQNPVYRGLAMHKGVSYPGQHQAIVDEELWSAVQSKLSGAPQQRRSKVESAAMLAGLIFDGRGNRMTPTYTMRRGSRYRYYVSRAPKENYGGRHRRVAADDTERLVIEAVGPAVDPGDLDNNGVHCLWDNETRDVVRNSIDKVVVYDEELHVMIKRRDEDLIMTLERDEDVPKTVVKVALSAAPRARKEILVPSSSNSGPRRVDRELVLALARARSWMLALRQGRYTDTAQIARRFGLSDPHVRRLLRLAYLGPEIVEAIAEGRQPRSLTVKRLLQGISLAWSDQRNELGFMR